MFDIPSSGVGSLDIVLTNTRSRTDDIGNDFVVDAIGFAPCYKSILSSFSNSSIIVKSQTCDNGSTTLYSSWPTNIPFQNPQYQWQRKAGGENNWSDISGATTQNYVQTENSPGIYNYRITSHDASDPTQILISNGITYYVQKLVVDANSTNLFACNGSNASGTLRGAFHLLYSDPDEASNMAYTYTWTPTTYLSFSDQNPTYITLPSPGSPPPVDGNPLPPTIYNFTFAVANSNYGCSSSNVQTVKLYNPRKVMVYNAFTPNNDGINDTFGPINIEDYPGSKFSIFNRWGQRVFHSEGSTNNDYRWDGRFQGQPQPSDVYTWTVELTACPDNIFSAGFGDGISHGTVTLIR